MAYHAADPDENIVTGYAYDGAGNRVRVTNTLGIVTAYVYDAANRLITVTENYVDGDYSAAHPDEDISTAYGYDAAGNQVVVTDSAGFVTRTFYDELNRPITVTQNYIGGGSYVPYDPQYPDRNISTFYGYDAAGNQVTVTNSLGMVTLTGYDQLNRPAVITQNYTTTTPNPDPDTYNLVTRYAYNAAGNQTGVTDPRGVATCYQYDALNRMTAVVENCVGLHGLPGPLNVTTEYEYDAAGNRTQVTDANENSTAYTYDELGRVLTVTGALGNETCYTYDAAGNRTAVTDAANVATWYNYDALGRLITVTENYIYLGPANADTNVVTAYDYDLLGNLTVITNARDYVITYTYDALSRLRVEADPMGHTWRYGYNALGWRTVMTDANETITSYEYDALGRLLSVIHGSNQVENYYAYNALGQRIAMTDTTGVTRYGYDDLGRVTGLTHTVGQQVDYTLGYRYDARSLRTGVVYPDSAVISYTYDAAARLTAVLAGATPYATYQYDAGGRLTEAFFANDVGAGYEYDAANRLAALTYQHATEYGPELLARYAYTYDQVGNRTRAVETVLDAGNEGQAARPEEEWLALDAPAAPRPTLSGTSWHGSLFAPLPQPPTPPIVRTRGNYRAAFDADGLRFYPRHSLFEEAEHEVAYRLTVVRRGRDVILRPGREEPVRAGENLVQYWRGDAFVEEYALSTSGVEQRFVFLQPVGGAGDLVIEGNLTGDLRPVWEPNTGEITFRLPGTDEVAASYGRAIVQDATGQRRLARLELDGAHLRIVVPGDWLAQAVYPVVVDPLIGANFAVSTQEIAGSQAQVAAAAGGSSASLVAWSSYSFAANGDIYAQLVLSSGALLSPTIPVYTGANNQQYPAVAADPAGPEYLVVWQSYENWNWNLYGQRVTATGVVVGSLLTFDAGTGDQQYPAVAHDALQDRYLVVWQSYASSRYGIYGRILQSDGTTLSPTVAITSSTTPLAYPDVAFNGATGEYLVVWQARTGSGGAAHWDVAGRRVGANGQVVGARLDVATDTGDQTVPAVAAAGSGPYLVVYQDAAGSGNVRGRGVTGNGAPFSAPFDIATGTAVQSNPDVAPGAALSEYLVTWESQTTMPPVSYDIAARRVTAAGQVVGDEIVVYAGSQDQRYPVTLYNEAAAAYLAVWQDGRLGGAFDWDTYGRRVGVDGSLPESDFLVSAAPASAGQEQVAVAYGAQQGLYLAVWRDYRRSNYDIYGQLIGPGGALVGAAISLTTAAAPEGTPVLAYNPTADEFLVVWAQSDGEEWDLVARRVSGAGVVQGSAFGVSSATGDQTAPAVACNPAAGTAGEWLVVWEDTRNGNYDLYGQRVDTGGVVSDPLVIWAAATASHQRHPDVAAAAATSLGLGYLVVAEDQAGSASDVRGVWLDLTGQPVDDVFTITAGSAWEGVPAVAHSAADGRFLVVWQEGSSSGDIWGRFVPLATGEPSAAFGIATTGASEEAPAVVWGTEVGEWYVAWQKKASALAPYDVQGAVLDAVGTLRGGVESLATAAQSQVGVALAYDRARSRYLAVWADSRNGPTAPDIYAQLARGYNLVVEYTYDGLYRLTGAAYSDGATYGYAYDRVGNRTRYTNTLAPVPVTTYQYDAADRLTAVTRAGVVTGYTWSARGELLADGAQEYAWDAAGRLSGVTGPAGLAVSYTYDGANSRVGVTVNGVATAYVVDPFSPVDGVSQVLVEEAGGATTRNLYGLDLFAQQEGETTTYLGYDALSVRLRLDDDGVLAAAYQYGPYGEVAGMGPAGYGYTGEQWDHTIKMTFLRARYYEPGTGRFISRDPWRGTLQQPHSLQYYGYAWSNPLRYRDPTGLQPFVGNPLENQTIIACYPLRLMWPVQHAPGQEPYVSNEFAYNAKTHPKGHKGLDIKGQGESFYEYNVQPPTGAGCGLNQLARKVYAAESGYVIHNAVSGYSPHHSWKLTKPGFDDKWVFEDHSGGFEGAVTAVGDWTAKGWTVVESHSPPTDTWKFQTAQQQGIKIKHAGGYETWYYHVRPIGSSLGNMNPPGNQRRPAVGSYVMQGEHIGYYDMLGPTSGPHLHFQLMIDNQPVNPRKFLQLTRDYRPPSVWYRY